MLGLPPESAQGCWIAALCLGVVVASALSVVYMKHVYRQQAQYLYHLTDTHDSEQAKWNQLQAEYASQSALDQVEFIAKNELGMRMPKPDDIGVFAVP